MAKLKKIAVIYIAVILLVSAAVPFAVAATNNDVIYNLDNGDGEKVVYLTFDDGPDNKNTLRAMEIMMEHNVKATFFFLGNLVESLPGTVKKVYDNGFGVAIHGYDHKNLKKLSAEAVDKQMTDTNDMIERATGARTGLMRPPYGDFNNATLAAIGEYKVCMWDIDTLDWSNKNTGRILDAVKKNLRPGAVILMHTGYGQHWAADALPEMIAYIKSQGYTMKAMPDPGDTTPKAKLADMPITVNGRSVPTRHYMIKDDYYIRLRDLAATVNGSSKQFAISLDKQKQAINILPERVYTQTGDEFANVGGGETRVRLESANLYVDGKPISVPYFSIDGALFFKMRDLLSALNIGTQFDAAAKAIKLDTTASYQA